MSKNLSTLLTTAAELRSGGASWGVVGRHVRRSPKTCGRWPSRFPDQRNQLYRTEQRKRYEESGDEALMRLRTLLRSDESKAQLRAAEILIRWGPRRALAELNQGELTQAGSPEQTQADREWAEMRQGAELTRQRMDKCRAGQGLPPLGDDEFFEEWSRELDEVQAPLHPDPLPGTGGEGIEPPPSSLSPMSPSSGARAGLTGLGFTLGLLFVGALALGSQSEFWIPQRFPNREGETAASRVLLPPPVQSSHMSELKSFSDIAPEDAELVGGKGLSLGLMASAGLPVPPGFCITTNAYRESPGSIDSTLFDALMDAYRTLGSGCVAVRSSATAEDGAATSFAGQQETILGVEGEQPLKEAVEKCWASLHTERAKAYRRKQGVDDAGLAMAVVVQRLVHAEVAGVLFTRDPLDSSGERMLIEASWGLGEAVVSGRVTPDSFQVDRTSGKVLNRRLGTKHIRITATDEHAVSEDQQNQFCLSDLQLAELAELGRKVEAYYGEPRDVEWAWADGRFWLLQARPITTASAADRERVRQTEIERLRQIADPRGTVWSRYNLIEVLPEPTPMTWAVVRQLLSGGGGTGMMYRDFGFKPDTSLGDLTAYDLIGGRPFCNLSREPRLQAKRPLFGYPFALFKHQSHLALDPKPDSSRMLGSSRLKRMLRWPGALLQLIGTTQRIQKSIRSFADNFRKTIVPAFVAEVDKAANDNLSRLDPPALVRRFEFWVKRTLIEFARESLKPTLFAQFSMQVLEQQLKKPLGPERTHEAVAELCAGAHPDPEANLAQAIRDVTSGQLDRGEFLRCFGHRGSHEMELSQPRWSEDADSLDRLLRGQHQAHETSPAKTTPKQRWETIAGEAKMNVFVAKSMAKNVENLHAYLGLRETAKHYLMRGYALIRSSLVELDRRFRLHGGIFFLIPDELPKLIAGENFIGIVEDRRKTRSIALSLEVPPVIFSDDLEAIGRPQPVAEGKPRWSGMALSAGVAEGTALVLTEPTSAPVEGGYILVCPSTDPAWVPLFVHAKGLVMESGGSLSHGAIVAREFGLPAIAGLPGIQRQIKTGQRLRVDGGRGTVSILE